MPSLDDLQRKVLSFRDERNWKQFHRPKDVVLSLVIEASELAEHFQWKSHDEALTHIARERNEVGNELADIFYWVLLIAADFEIDLGDALERKLALNAEKYPVARAYGRKDKYTEL